MEPPPVWPLGSGTDITQADLPLIQKYETELANWNSRQVAIAQAARQAAAEAAVNEQVPAGKNFTLSADSGGRRRRQSRRSKRSRKSRRTRRR
jgi:hypothetical protein